MVRANFVDVQTKLVLFLVMSCQMPCCVALHQLIVNFYNRLGFIVSDPAKEVSTDEPATESSVTESEVAKDQSAGDKTSDANTEVKDGESQIEQTVKPVDSTKAQTIDDDAMDLDSGDEEAPKPTDIITTEPQSTDKPPADQSEDKENGSTEIDQSETVASDKQTVIAVLDDEEGSKPATPAPIVGDLRVMAKEELPSQDVLDAGIQALIAKAQDSSAMLDQIIKQKKVSELYNLEIRTKKFKYLSLFSHQHFNVDTRSPKELFYPV